MNYLDYFKLKDAMELIQKLFEMVTLKAVATIVLIILSFGFDDINTKALVALFILMWGDCFTAIWAAYKTGTLIESARIFRTPIKIVIYFGLVYAARLTEYALPSILMVLDETVIAFCVTTELISIMENVNKLGYAVPTKLLSKLINIRDTQ